MLSNSPPTPASTPRSDEAARTEPLIVDPKVIIEVASDGTGSTNDGSPTAKPPGACDSGDPAACF